MSTSGPPNASPGEFLRAERFGSRTILALVLIVVTILFIGFVASLPWWSLDYGPGGSRLYHADWYLGSACDTRGNCFLYSQYSYQGLGNVSQVTNALVLGSLGFAILTLASFVVSIFRPRLGLVALVAGGLGSLIALVAPVYFFVALGSAIAATHFSTATGFFSSSTTAATSGGVGWYLAFGAFMLFLVSTLVVRSGIGRLRVLGNVRIERPPDSGSLPPQAP